MTELAIFGTYWVVVSAYAALSLLRDSGWGV